MARSLLVLGCGGHGRVVADTASECGYTRIAFLDDRPTELAAKLAGVLGPMDMLDDLAGEWDAAIAAVGDSTLRLALLERIRSAGFEVPSVVHPSAIVNRRAQIGAGVLVGAGAIINVFARIGDAAIVNTGARIDHDCVVGRGSHIAPGATLSGDVKVGERAWLGTGCAVRQGVTIGADVMVGVGAAVVSDLAAGETYIGVPARALTRPL